MTTSQEYKDNVQRLAAFLLLGMWAGTIDGLSGQELKDVIDDERVLAQAMSADMDPTSFVDALDQASSRSLGVISDVLKNPEERGILIAGFSNCVEGAQAL